MRIAWYSNAPDTPTGYGTQTRQVITRLMKDGHEVHVLANFGQISGVRDYEGAAVWPGGVTQYSLDVVDAQCEVIKPDLVITLYDTWVLKDQWKDYRVASWTPIDHLPPPPGVLRWVSEHDTIAMSEYGRDMLRKANVESTYIPHGIETGTFRPMPSDARRRMKVPDDAFVVTMPSANIGVTPPRKEWSTNLQAVAAFMRDHDDVYLYLHTDLVRPNGVPLHILIDALGIPTDRIRKPDQMAYRASLIPNEEMARIYSTSDVVLMATKGEGFGLGAAEGMACGTPAIVSDFTAQPEIVGDTGWKVPGQLDWDHNQAAFFFSPFVAGIREALEAAYEDRGSEERSAACVERARERYDADTVYAQMWRPFLESIGTPKERKGNSKAAKRRKRRNKRK